MGWLKMRIMCQRGTTCTQTIVSDSPLALKILSVLVFNKIDIIISLKFNLLSPWQSWKIAYLVLNNNHSLTDNSSQQNMSRIQNSQFEYIVLTFTTVFNFQFWWWRLWSSQQWYKFTYSWFYNRLYICYSDIRKI